MAEPKREQTSEPVIRVMMMPRDTNAHGTIFGGVLLSYLDQAGAIQARTLGCSRVVTVAMDSVEFKQPVYVGDVLSFYAETLSIGRTSARIRVIVEAERSEPPCERVRATTAELVYVAIDENRKAIPFQKCADAESAKS
ncbi:MAG: acyl-CoA thioesterase [Phycisphaerales bacterium]|nr:acyl-CoA thioesterase [Phycisphaerales bacterium]